MNILVDHGRSENFGDMAMVAGTVAGLHRIFPTAELHLTEDGLWNSGLFNHPYVTDIPLYHISAQWSDPFVQAQPRRGVRVSRKAALWRKTQSPITWPILNTVRRFQRHMYAKSWRMPIPVHELECEMSRGSEPLLKWCDQFDMGVIGGGIVTDEFSPSLHRQCMLMHAFHALKKPFYVLSVQYGPFNSEVLRKAANRSVATATACTVRSKDLPEGIATRFMPDMSVGLDVTDEADNCLRNLGLQPGKYLAYHMRSSFYNPNMRKYMRKYAEVLRRLSAALHMPLLHVPISLKESDDDRKWGRRLSELLGDTPNHVIEDVDLKDARAIKGVMGNAYGVLGVSFHACQFALSQGVPAVSIAAGDHYGFKAKGIVATFGDNRLAANIKQQSVDDVTSQCLDVFSDTALRSSVAKQAEQYEQDWPQTFRVIVAAHEESEH